MRSKLVTKPLYEKIKKLRADNYSWDAIGAKFGMQGKTASDGFNEFLEKEQREEKKEEATLGVEEEHPPLPEEPEKAVVKSKPAKGVGGKKMAEGTGQREMSVKFDARMDPTTYSVADQLVKQGIAENQSDAVRKSLRLLYAVSNPGQVQSMGEGTQALAEKVQSQKGLGDILNMKKQMYELQQLDNALGKKEDGMGIDMGKILQYQMIQNLMRPSKQNDGNGSQYQMLASQIKDMQSTFQQQIKEFTVNNQHKQEINEMKTALQQQMDRQQQAIKEATTNKGFDIEKFLTLTNTANEKQLALIQGARTKEEEIKAQSNEQLAHMNSKLEDVKQKMQEQQLEFMKNEMEKIRNDMHKDMQGAAMTKSMRDKVDGLLLKNFDKALDHQEGGKSKDQLITDLIGSTMDKIKEPILAPLGQAMAQRAMQMPSQVAPQAPHPSMPAQALSTAPGAFQEFTSPTPTGPPGGKK